MFAKLTPEERGKLLRGIDGLAVVTGDERGDYELQFERESGSGTAGDSFGQIAAVAASESGVLAVADRAACTVSLFDVSSGRILGSYGGCGDGPGEMRRPAHMAFGGDTLFVWDSRLESILVYSIDRGEVRRIRPQREAENLGTTYGIGYLDDSTLVLSIGVSSYAVPSDDRHAIRFLWLMDLRTGRMRKSLVEDSEFGAGNGRLAERGLRICSGVAGSSQRIAVSNPWIFEGIVLSGSDLSRTHSRFVTRVSYLEPEEERPRVWGRRWAEYVACSGAGALFQVWSKTDNTNDELVTHLEVRDYDGSLLTRVDAFDRDSAFLGTPGAGAGSRFYFVENREAPVPTVYQYQLVRVQAKSRPVR